MPTATAAAPGPVMPGPVEAFVADLSAAIRRGDTPFLLSRAHSSAVDLYGREMCQDHFTNELSPDPTHAFEVLSTQGPAHIQFTMDGRELAVDSAYEVGVRFIESGSTGERTVYVAEEVGGLKWFPDCGRPILSNGQADRFLLARVEGDGTSKAFESTDSWRIEARAAARACTVILHDAATGGSRTLRSSEESFVIQTGGRGTYRVQSVGCTTVSVFENTAET